MWLEEVEQFANGAGRGQNRKNSLHLVIKEQFFYENPVVLLYSRLHCSVQSEVVKLLVGNKVDQERVVLREVAEAWAKSRGMLFIESSAKTTEGVSQVFNEVVQQVSRDCDTDDQLC